MPAHRPWMSPVRNAELMSALRKVLHCPAAPPTPAALIGRDAVILSTDPALAPTLLLPGAGASPTHVYEDDEPAEKVRAAFERGEKGLTAKNAVLHDDTAVPVRRRGGASPHLESLGDGAMIPVMSDRIDAFLCIDAANELEQLPYCPPGHAAVQRRQRHCRDPEGRVPAIATDELRQAFTDAPVSPAARPAARTASTSSSAPTNGVYQIWV